MFEPLVNVLGIRLLSPARSTVNVKPAKLHYRPEAPKDMWVKSLANRLL